MASPYLLKGLYKRGPGNTKQLVKFDAEAIVLRNGSTLEAHVNDMSAHLPFTDIDNTIVQRIHTAIGRVLDGGDGSTLLNKHATMKLLSEDISTVSNKLNTFLHGLADGGLVDRLSEIVTTLDTYGTDISNVKVSIGSLPTILTNLDKAIVDIVTLTNTTSVISDHVDELLPLISGYDTLTSNLVTLSNTVESINTTISILPDLSNTVNTHGVDIVNLRTDLTILNNTVDTLIPLADSYSNLLTIVNGIIIDVNNLQTELDTTNGNIDVLSSALDSRLSTVESNVTINTADISNNRDSINTISNTVTSQGFAITNLSIDVEKNTTDIDTIDDTLEVVNTTLVSHGSSIDSNSNDISLLQSNVTEIQSDVNSISNTLIEHGVSISNNSTEIDNTKNLLSTQATAILEINDSLDILTDTTNSHSNSLVNVNQDISDLTNTTLLQDDSISGLATKVAEHDTTLEQHSTSIATLNTDLNTISSVVDIIEDNVNSNSSSIAGLTLVLQTTQNTVSDHSISLSTHNDDISDLKSSQATQDVLLSSIVADVANNTSSISDLSSELETTKSTVVTQGNIISTNTGRISGLESSQVTQDLLIQNISDSVNVLSSELEEVAETVDLIISNISPRVIGICHFPNSNAQNNFRHINQEGNFLSGFKYYTSPIYTDCMRDVIVGTDYMKEIDLLYIKTTVSGPPGTDSEGKMCWWISPDPLPGFRPMLAFRRDGVVKPYTYIGTYMGYHSQPDIQPSNGYNKATYFNSLSTNKNSGGATGFRMMDIYDLGLLRTLILILGGNADVQTVWGDNFSNEIRPVNGATNARALGMYDLWRSYLYMVDKIKLTPNRKIVLVDPFNGNTIATNLDMPYTTANRYISEIMVGDLSVGGETHDYMELFIPAAFVTDIRDAAYQDGIRFTSTTTSGEKDIYIGGSPKDSKDDFISPGGILDSTKLFSGIFMCTIEHNLNHTSSYSSMRLAKS